MPAEALIPAVVQQVIDATNAGDSARFLDAFAQDGVIDDWGRTFRGREAISGWNDGENIGMHSQIAVQGSQVDGDEVTLTIYVTGDGYNGGGSFGFVVHGGKVARMTIRG